MMSKVAFVDSDERISIVQNWPFSGNEARVMWEDQDQ
jgi:hypothetical protein